MGKGKRFLGIFMTLILLLSMQMTCFAQKDGETAGDGGDMDTELPSEGQEENTEIYEKLYTALLNYEASIDLTEYKLLGSEARALYQRVVNENPDLFYVTSRVHLEYDYDAYLDFEDEDGDFEDEDEDFEDEIPQVFVTEVFPYYGARKEEIKYMKESFQAAMDEALSGLDEGMSDVEKALYLHDYIIQHCQYDWWGFQYGYMEDISCTAYGCLVYGETNSSGYVLAYSYLLKAVGIESRYIEGYSHAWNAVKMDGNYYFVDLHCDNPIRHLDGEGCCFDYVGHDSFLLGEDDFMVRNDDLSHDWERNAGIEISKTNYGPLEFRKVSSPMCYYKGNWYYWRHLEQNLKKPAIMKTDDLGSVGTIVRPLDDFHWYTMETGKIWKGYNGNIDISPERGKLYYCSSNQIFSLDLEDLEASPKLLCNVDVQYGYIYGLKVLGDALIYGTAETPHHAEYQEWVDLRYMEETPLIVGDLNGNGEIESGDALILLRREVQLQTPDFEAFLADCDGDGKSDSSDALWILRKELGVL